MSTFGTIVQGILAGATASLLVLFGYPRTGVYFALATTVLALTVWGVNWGPQSHQATKRPIWLVPLVSLTVIGIPCAALHWVPKRVVGAPPHEWEPQHQLAVLAMTALANAVFSVMWLSTIVDRCYVLPRLAGGAGKRPCTHSLDRCWHQLTRLWFLHRLIATVTLVAATITIVAVAANEWLLS